MLQRNTSIAIMLAVLVVILFIMLGFFGINGLRGSAPQGSSGAQAILDELSATGTVADLRTYDIIEGSGAEAKAGDVVVVNYRGVLPDGTQFDSSYDRGQPFTFELGARQVISGWESGFSGMKVGGRRLLVIPPSLGYGPTAIGSIPANSTLIFDVELLQVISKNAVDGSPTGGSEAQ